MADLQAVLFTFSKRENSTKRPTLNTGTTVSITLKSPTSILNPVIELQYPMTSSPVAFNYMYIQEFGRYYWLTSPGWVWDNRLWVGYFSVDVMASWKTQIGSSDAYVLRSASDWDGFITDNYYPAKVGPTILGNVINTGYESSMANGCYVVGVITGNTPGCIGATTYYVMDNTTMAQFLDEIINTSAWSSISDISNDLLKTIFNPYQYIVSCTWFPFSPATLPISGNQTVHFGWWQLSVTAPTLLHPEMYKNYNGAGALTVPKHPDASTRGAYLDAPPYSMYQLEFYPFGVFQLPSLAGTSKLQIRTIIDCVTGTAVMIVESEDTGELLATSGTQFGMPIQLAQSGSNILSGAAGTVASAGALVAGAATGNVPAVIAGAAGGIGSSIDTWKPKTTVSGFNGSKATLLDTISIIGEFYRQTEDDIVEHGKPLCKKKTISSLSGYILCADADPVVACSDTELSEIVKYMNTGFFYE